MFPTGYFASGYFAPRYFERPTVVTPGIPLTGSGGGSSLSLNTQKLESATGLTDMMKVRLGL